ncbi:MAG: hypothetical protein WC901_07900 [Candidatus Margulisiibacteriota bacterium]
MNKASSFFGYKCSKCNTKIDIAAMAGSGEYLCPNCKGEMIPDEQGQISSANVHCSNCNINFGLINSDKCPNCGKPFAT